ncbi:multidrug effflux MFS transporter [Pseudoruegeria sp. SHC-113]|uniref:multidrug effflux MFS transporter n=1 Tax=Pseudoruegeria sp. SHC-113 TaxID=2855439 RepID=UPI0021BBB474|nr:multidrug effflux MFS transporter [Pseudoruegeria sp. SHC-113]MCT8160445.1 multidrug effflux MFS transporter [Pseudoruegeria sp. SHC-113]
MNAKPLKQGEFIALCAMLMAMIAFAIDAMLPAMTRIAEELTPDDPGNISLVIAIFMLGMGVGTLFAGPLSDSIGRRPVIIGGTAVYCAMALLCAQAQSLDVLLIARFLMGIGVAGPRIATQAMIRDLYAGEKMAKIVSFMMMIFVLVPAAAPAVGLAIMAVFDWRAIFVAFVLFALFAGGWYALRQPETLPQENRRPFTFTSIAQATREMMGVRMVVVSIAVQTLTLGMLLGVISSIQPLFAITYGRETEFAFWFACIALLAGTGNVINARLVERYGMRPLATMGYAVQIGFAALALGLSLAGLLNFWLFLFWIVTVFYMVGFTLGNLNALAMEPLGHIAGIAASVMGAISTVGGAVLAGAVGLLFAGTATPLAATVLICCLISTALMRSIAGEKRIKRTA